MATDPIEIKNALDNFEMERARNLLRGALKNPSAEIYFLASLAALNDSQRISFLEKAVELDPFHEAATEDLAKFKGAFMYSQSTSPQTDSTKSQIIQPETSEVSPDNFVTGIVVGDEWVSLYQIPHVKSGVRTEMEENSSVILISRNENANWYNVIYFGSTEQPVLGWVEAEYVDSVSVKGKPVNILDLPISKFEWNTRDEIKTLILLVQQKQNTLVIPSLLITFSGFISCISIFEVTNSFYPDDSTYILIIAGIIGVLTGLRWFFNLIKEKPNFNVVQLRNIERERKTDNEKNIETQAKLAAINVGLNLGKDLVIKYSPDKKRKKA